MIRRLGLVLALAAYAVLALHVDHADADHSTDPSHHCCPCHLYSAAGQSAAAALSPYSGFEDFQPQAAAVVPRQVPLRDCAARAPPSVVA